MSSLVLELQQLAANGSTSVAELLRRSRMVATKLNLVEMNAWIESEMHGYSLDVDLPSYRVLKGELVARNPVNGILMPLRFEPKLTQNISTIAMRDSVGKIVELATSADAEIDVRFDNEVEAGIRLMMSEFHRAWVIPFARLYGCQLLGVLDTVRNKILDWSLQLESMGILGENLTFSETEKLAASTTFTINNFSGNLNAVSNSTLSSSNISQRNSSVVKGDKESLLAYLRSIGVDENDLNDLDQAIAVDSKSRKKGIGEKVLAWLGKINLKSASSEVATGAAGNLIASAIQSFFG